MAHIIRIVLESKWFRFGFEWRKTLTKKVKKLAVRKKGENVDVKV